MNCWNPLKPLRHSVARKSEREGLKRERIEYTVWHVRMGNQQLST